MRNLTGDMTEQEQRIAIAEACGYMVFNPRNANRKLSNGSWECVVEIPDYPNDLNAMHEAEKTLSMGQLIQYSVHLNRMDLAAGNYGYVENVINATARQRAEAFLLTIGKWK